MSPMVKVLDAILKSARNPSIGDSSQQVVFEKVVRDLLEDDPEIRRTAAFRLDEVYDEEEEGEVEFESLLDENP